MDLAEDQILSADQDSEIRCEEFLRVKIGEPFPVPIPHSPDAMHLIR